LSVSTSTLKTDGILELLGARRVLQGVAALEPKVTFPGVSLGPHQFETTFSGIFTGRV
jgi:hypothetical protein